MEENENLIKTKNIMCLTLREQDNLPYNKKKIRWKLVISKRSFKGETVLNGKYTYQLYAKRGVWMTATKNKAYPNSAPTDIGFHVYITRKDARYYHSPILKVIKVEVDGFNASGYYGQQRSETWKKMRIL